jgi:hypothetical protein
MTDRPKLPWLSPACTTEQRVKFVPIADITNARNSLTCCDRADCRA